MKRKPRVLFDVDGVLTDGFADACCALIRERTGIDAQSSKITQWDIMKSFGVPGDVAKGIYETLKGPGVAAAMTPIDGSQALIADIEKWADVYMVTSPMGGPHWKHDREDWLYRIYNTPARRVAPIHDKHIVFGDAIVEDKYQNLVDFTAEWKHSLGIMIRKPYNQHETWTPTVGSYDELRTVLETVRKRFY